MTVLIEFDLLILGTSRQSYESSFTLVGTNFPPHVEDSQRVAWSFLLAEDMCTVVSDEAVASSISRIIREPFTFR